MFGPKNIWKNFESKKFTSEKIFGLKKILVWKKNFSKNIFGQKKYLSLTFSSYQIIGVA